MAIRDLQRALTEVGRIRLGQKVKTSNGKERPDKLDTFRFTSAAEHLIIEIAALYGGIVKPWDGGRGKQWEVIVDSTLIPIYLPRQSIEPWYEAWKGGVCQHRCDGVHDHLTDSPCSCDAEERSCKPTTRVNVLLADVPGLGVWRVESHGYYAASELSQLADLIAGISMPLPGRLMLEARGRKFFNRKTQKVEVRDYFVPVVLIDSVTARQVHVGGDALTRALQMGRANAALTAVESAPAARAIEATPTVATEPDPKVVERGLTMIGSATPGQMSDIHARIKKMGSPQVLVDAFQLRLGEHAVTKEQADAELEASWADGGEGEHAPVQPEDAAASATEAVEVEAQIVEDSGDRGAAVMELLSIAGKLKLNTKQVDEKIFERYGVARTVATAAQLTDLATWLRSDGQ